jgi:hypothetical protein
MLTPEQAKDIRDRNNAVRNWLTTHKKNSYISAELSEELGIELPTNEETSALEVYEFITDPPVRYFLYISCPESALSLPDHRNHRTVRNGASGLATTWTGEKLGDIQFGKEFRSAFGDRRVSLRVYVSIA